MDIIRLTSDTMFKTIIKSCAIYTKKLLSLIMELDDNELSNMSFENSELEINSKDDKKQAADLIIKNDNRFINLEMNKFYHKYTLFRNLTYLYKISLKDIKKGIPYNNEKTYIQINFNNYNSGNRLVNKYCYREIKMEDILIDNFIVYNIDLAKLSNIKYTESVNKKLVQYLKVITCNSVDELNELAKDDQILKGVVNMAEEKSLDNEIRGGYNKEEEDERIRLTIQAEGKAEGKAEGESKKSLEIAKNLLEQKYNLNMISKATGLSLNELKRISL